MNDVITNEISKTVNGKFFNMIVTQNVKNIQGKDHFYSCKAVVFCDYHIIAVYSQNTDIQQTEAVMNGHLDKEIRDFFVKGSRANSV